MNGITTLNDGAPAAPVTTEAPTATAMTEPEGAQGKVMAR